MRKSGAVFFLFAFGVFAFDQLTKYLVRHYLYPLEIKEVLPFFNLVYVENVGSAFGMFKSLGNAFFIGASAVAILFVAVLIIKDRDDRLGSSLILAGALGNLTDRVLFGCVTDFLDLYAGRFHWPAFNVADSALTIGISLLLIRTLFFKKAAGGGAR